MITKLNKKYMKHSTKTYNKTKLTLSTLIVAIITIFIIFTGYGVYSFFTTFGIQTPIILRSPIYKLHPEVLISPIGSKSASLGGEIDLDKIAARIYTLESSNGKNDSCNQIGKFNGYGYRQNSFEWVCYDSHAEAKQHVINWLLANLKDKTIEQAMCLYNQGRVTDGCTYAINYKSL